MRVLDRALFCLDGHINKRSLLGLRCVSVVAALCLGWLPPASTQAQTAYFNGGTLTLSNGFSDPSGVAVDKSGNVFVADQVHFAVKEIPAGCVSPSCVTTLGGGFSAPDNVAVDGSGNIYVADQGGAVKEIPASCISGANNSSCVITLGGGFSGPAGVAVDGSGNVYVADTFHNAVKEIPVSCISGANDSSCVTTLGGGFYYPNDVAVDGSGNVYVADTQNGAVKEIPVSCISGANNSSCVTALGGGFSAPYGVSVDGSGNVYVATSTPNSTVKEIPVSCISGANNSSCVTALGTGFSYPDGVAVDGSGNIFVADTGHNVVKEIQLAGVNVGTVPVATPTSPKLTLQFTFTGVGTIGAPVVMTQGATGKDFNDAGTGSCTTNGTTHSYAVGDTCTVDVTFTPTRPGARYGAVQLLDSTGAVIATGYVYGTGSGPQIVYGPGSQSTLGSGFQFPAGVAVDGYGNIFVTDIIDNTAKEILAAGGYSTVRTLASGFSQPSVIAVDGSGNVFVGDVGNGSVTTIKEIVAINGSIPATPTITAVGPNLSLPCGIAADGSGNLFVAECFFNNDLKEILAAGGYTTVKTLGSGFSNPTGVAVDGNGNVFVEDSGTHEVKEIVAVDGNIPTSPTIKVLASGFSNPIGVTVDAGGNVFVVDSGNGAVKEIVAVNGVIPASPTINTLGSGFSGPQGIAVDGSGNIFVADTGNSHVEKLDYADVPKLTFATATNDGSTDTTDGNGGMLSVTITNDGNQPLTAVSPGLSVAANFTQVGSGGSVLDCSSNFSLAEDESCNLSVEFAPVAPASGTVNGSVVLTDNNLNAASATQTITLTGTAVFVAPATHYSISAPATVVSYGPAFSITITALDASNNVATGYNGTASLTSSDPGVAFVPNPVTFVNGIAQPAMGMKGAGLQSVTATDTSNPGINGSTSILVTPGATIRLVLSAPSTATPGTAFNFTVVAQDLYGNTTPAYSGTVQFSSTDGLAVLPANSTLTNGIGTFSATLNAAGSKTITATDTTNSSLTATSSISVSQKITVTNLAVSSGTVAKGTPVTLTATVTAGGNPVTNGIVGFYEQVGSELVSLGDAQIVAASSNSAALKYTFGPGTTAIVAKFHATTPLQSSQSTAQTVTVTGLDATTTAIASSGTVGNYTLTGAVTAFGTPALTGSVSFENQSNGNAVLSTIPLDSTTLTNSFSAAQSYATGTNPYGVAAADLNGDGIPDLAVANHNSANVSVLLGNGDGTFATAVDYPAGSGPSSVVIGDFNRDGIPDLAVTNYGANTVSILLGNGNGTFQSQQTFAVGSYPIDVVIGDFNQDGIPDLAVANYSAGLGTVSILLGNGNGTFQTQQTFAAGDAPYSIAVADLDNNGTQDLVVANAGGSNISVLLGNGNGTFQTQVAYPVNGTGGAFGVAVGDFNGDGIPDVAVATATNVSVWLGTGSGTLHPAVGYNAGNTPYAIMAHDLFGSGKLDLVVVNANGNNISILTGTGDGTFGSPANYSTSNAPQALTVGDFNGDGRPDLAIVTGDGNNANIFLGEQTESATATGVSVSGGGTQNIFANYPGSTNYASSVSSTVALTGSQATQTITFPAPTTPVIYGVAPITLTATASSSLAVSYAVTGPANLSGSTLTITGAGTVAITVSQTGNASYLAATPVTQSITVNKAAPMLSWATPAAIVYGTALSNTQLNASATGVGGANLSGSFTYNPLAGTVLTAGPQSLQVSFAPADTTDYTTVTASTDLSVTKQPTLTVVSVNPMAATPVQSVTLTATVSATVAGTVATPTQTVIFLDNGVQLGSAVNVVGGTATLVVPSLPAGTTAVITATYQGDNNFLSSTSTNSASVVVAPLDFTFTNTGTSAYTAAPGAIATYSYALTPLYGSYPNTVSFNITGMPTGTTASFTPSSVAVNGGAASVVMTVQTAAAMAQNHNRPFGRGIMLALLLLPFMAKRRVREKLRVKMLLLVLLTAGVTAGLSGCGSQNGFLLQSQQTYTLTVTATSGTVQHSQNVTLIVQ